MENNENKHKTGFKGFDKDFKCRDMQYEVGKEFTADGVIEPCKNGLHYCENPLDVLSYYGPVGNRFAEVENRGTAKNHADDSKIATSALYVKTEISLSKLLSEAASFILSKVDFKNAPATNTGDKSAATNTGDKSAATNTGHQSAATNTGDYSAATNTGNQSAATNTGNYSAATNTGYQSAATNTGYQSAATNTGDKSAATNTGNYSAATVEGKDSVAIVTGIEGKASGKIGCYIVLTEWEYTDTYHIKDVKAFRVDGKKIKEDTFYSLIGGKAIEQK
jgi:hypothetical protein